MFRAQIQVPAAAIFAALSNLRLAFSVNGPCKENTAAVDRNNASRNPRFTQQKAPLERARFPACDRDIVLAQRARPRRCAGTSPATSSWPWIVTLPAAALFAAAFYELYKVLS